MLTRRIIYHSALNGEAVNQYSATFRNIQYHMQNFVQQTNGGNGNAVIVKAQALIGQHVVSQAFVQAINDDFYLAGGITLLCLAPILFLRTKKKKSSEHIAIME
jgi:DHA2 family multidrug resistance protein